jgi:hemerythrin-like domain-containing protein
MATTHKTQTSKASKDAIALLRKDHDTVRKLLSELEQTTTRAAKKREALLMEIALEVEVHAAIEEEIFYPAFRERGQSGEDEKLFLEAAEEHALVHQSLPELQATDPGTELFSARAKVLKDLIEHHAEEEESELLPRAKELLSKAELVELGERLQTHKMELIERYSRGHRPNRRNSGSKSAHSRARR